MKPDAPDQDRHDAPNAPPDEMVARLDGNPHLWTFPLDPELTAAWIDEHAPMLSDDERERYNRYLRSADRQLFLAAHVFVRQTLSRYAPIAPSDWTFHNRRHGRPEIANPESPPGLRFNLAHTAGMVAVLVHDSADGGVDVEHRGNVDDPMAMSRTVFADRERNRFLDLGEDQQELEFYKLWTLKEAFMKAKGKGLSMPLKDFSFTGLDSGDIRVDCGHEIEPEPDAWHFTLHQPSTRFVIATAYRSADRPQARSVSVFQL